MFYEYFFPFAVEKHLDRYVEAVEAYYPQINSSETSDCLKGKRERGV